MMNDINVMFIVHNVFCVIVTVGFTLAGLFYICSCTRHTDNKAMCLWG